MKTTLFIMTQKGYETLKTLISNNYHHIVNFVVVGRDKNINNDYAQEIIDLCKKNNINYYEKKADYSVKSEYSIAISWRWLIKTNNSKLIVLHDSLLPKYRGFAPLVNSLINKEEKIGVTALYANDKYDRGNILFQSSTKINYPIKINETIEIVSKNYTELILKIFKNISNKNPIKGCKQKDEDATYSLWRDEDDYLIDWSKDSDYILRFINAVGNPYKGASSYIKNEKVRILEASKELDVIIENRTPGKIIFIEDGCPVIVCKKGLIKILKIINDKNGKSILPLKSFRTIFKNN